VLALAWGWLLPGAAGFSTDRLNTYAEAAGKEYFESAIRYSSTSNFHGGEYQKTHRNASFCFWPTHPEKRDEGLI
jgi:hypothetical protein